MARRFPTGHTINRRNDEIKDFLIVHQCNFRAYQAFPSGDLVFVLDGGKMNRPRR